MIYLRQETGVQEQIDKGIRILKDGGVIVFPTDTVYGLGVDAFNLKAVERIYDIKNRPSQLPFPLLIADIAQLIMVAEPAYGIALFLARRFWPGGLTLVLPKVVSLPSYLAQGSTVAVRMPNHPVCLSLIRGLGAPVIGTSANLSGNPSALTADEAKQQIGDKVDLVIDGGRCSGGVESTIVDATGGTALVLRQGIIAWHEIEEAIREYRESSSDAYSFRL